MELNLAELSQLAGPCCVTISALAIDPQNNGTVYVATAGTSGALWKSTDGGSSWRNPFPSRGPIRALAVDPKDSARIYTATDSGVTMSTDAGESWASIPGTPASASFLTIDPQNLNAVYAGGSAGLFEITLLRTTEQH